MGLTQRLGTIPLAIQTDTSNNVGIGGAANASFKLQVTGTTNLTGALSGTSATFSNLVSIAAFTTSDLITSPQLSLTRSGTQFTGIAIRGSVAADRAIFSVPNDDALYIGRHAGGGGAWTKQVAFLDNGNIAIGTTNPQGGGGGTDRTLGINSGSGAATFITGLVNEIKYSTLFTSSSQVVLESNAAIPILFKPNGTTALTLANGGAATFSSSVVIQGQLSADGIIKQQTGGQSGIYATNGSFVSSGGSTTTFFTFANLAKQSYYQVVVSQRGAGGNIAMSMITMFNANSGSNQYYQDNTNPALYLTINMSGLDLRLTTGSGYGATTWEYTITQIK